ncbi:MAG: TetR/AcrR family transcriptional regulator [Gammaproteobacteria bacterium]|nr:TetR/AcrR family transcriptional regulator [Gammaproteobacteria bacterium]
MTIATVDAIAELLDEFLWPGEDEKQRRKRERILVAATELFVRMGYRKTSVDSVARRAGIAKGTVYLYYRNKAELVFHAIALEERSYLDRLAPLDDPSLTPRDRLRLFLALWGSVSYEMPLLTSLSRGDREIELAIQDIDSKVLTQINEWQTEFTVRLLDEATQKEWPPGLLEERATVLIDMLFAVMTSAGVLRNDLPRERYASVLADVIVDGIVSSPDARPEYAPPTTGVHHA